MTTIKSITQMTPGTSYITAPAGIVSGDLLVMAMGTYNTIPGISGWTSAVGSNGTGTYTDYGYVFYKWATGSESGTNINFTGWQASYSGAFLIVASGADATTPIVANSLGGSGTAISAASITTTIIGKVFAFFTQMGNATSPQTLSSLTAGWTQQGTTILGSGGYHVAALAQKDGTTGAATYTTPTMTSGQSGGNVGVLFAIQGNEPAVVNTITPTYADNRTAPVVFNWTYTDAESDTQTQYEIGYRLKSSTGAYTTVTNTSSTTSHSFASSTFTYGEEYEVRVRVYTGTQWGNYTTIYFTSGTAPWTYSPEYTGTTGSGGLIQNVYYNDFETSAADWQSNAAFGAYFVSTVARQTTNPGDGLYSLKVTTPSTVSPNIPTWANTSFAVIPGEVYRVDAVVMATAGSGPLGIDCVFNDTISTYTTSTNVYESITGYFIPTSTTAFVGVNTVGAYSANSSFYLDYFYVKHIPLYDGGQYELQLRTSNASGYGPWSTTSTFIVNREPTATSIDVNPKSIGGNSNVTWTYTDADGNAQYNYQIRHRKRT